MTINDSCFKLILRYANKYKPPKHNTKYSNYYYLTQIMNVLGDVVRRVQKNYVFLFTATAFKIKHSFILNGFMEIINEYEYCMQ